MIKFGKWPRFLEVWQRSIKLQQTALRAHYGLSPPPFFVVGETVRYESPIRSVVEFSQRAQSRKFVVLAWCRQYSTCTNRLSILSWFFKLQTRPSTALRRARAATPASPLRSSWDDCELWWWWWFPFGWLIAHSFILVFPKFKPPLRTVIVPGTRTVLYCTELVGTRYSYSSKNIVSCCMISCRAHNGTGRLVLVVSTGIAQERYYSTLLSSWRASRDSTCSAGSIIISMAVTIFLTTTTLPGTTTTS